jgi:CheY-like chemotaxis protein
MIYFPTTVVLVDDDIIFLNSVKSYLTGLNVRLVTFTSPSEAKKFIEESFSKTKKLHLFPPEEEESYLEWAQNVEKRPFENLLSCVVSDFHMPQKNGLSLLKQVQIPVRKLLLTGVLDHNTAVDAFNHRIIHKFLPKGDLSNIEKLQTFIHEEIKAYFSTLFSLGSPALYVEQVIDLCTELNIQSLFPLDLCGAYKAFLKTGKEVLFFCPNEAHLKLQIQYAKQAGVQLSILNQLKNKQGYLIAPVDQLIEEDLSSKASLLFQKLNPKGCYSEILGYFFVEKSPMNKNV